MFHSFSAYSNSLKIWNTRSPKDSLDFLNGMRVLSMCWVILGHTHAYASMAGIVGKHANSNNQHTFGDLKYFYNDEMKDSLRNLH